MPNLKSWKYPSILLMGIGVSNLGSWIYFIALNLIVLDLTNSPLAVSVLYILKPIATLFTNFWSGSLIDRLNKRNLMVTLDILRALLIALLPSISSMWYTYGLVILINMAGSIFGPASLTYTTKLIPPDQRQRFNSLHSLMGSGAFLTGPAIAGFLFLMGSPMLAIYINSFALLISGLVTLLLPNLEKEMIVETIEPVQNISLATLKADWYTIMQFYKRNLYIMTICFLFGSVTVVMASAVDSLEASFAKLVLYLPESEYGVLVSIAGVGIIAGAMCNALLVKKLKSSLMIGVGTLGMCSGYLIYAFSNSFIIAAVGFILLGFCLAFLNTGFATFFQNNIPSEVMGRVASVNDLIQAVLIIITTLLIGLVAEILSIQIAVISGVLVMLVLSIILCTYVLKPSKRDYYTIEPFIINDELSNPV